MNCEMMGHDLRVLYGPFKREVIRVEKFLGFEFLRKLVTKKRNPSTVIVLYCAKCGIRHEAEVTDKIYLRRVTRSEMLQQQQEESQCQQGSGQTADASGASASSSSASVSGLFYSPSGKQ